MMIQCEYDHNIDFVGHALEHDRYYVAYKPIIFLHISFIFIEMKFIHCHSYMMFAMKSMSICK